MASSCSSSNVGSNSLEDLLSSDVDESAISSIVNSIESHLSSENRLNSSNLINEENERISNLESNSKRVIITPQVSSVNKSILVNSSQNLNSNINSSLNSSNHLNNSSSLSSTSTTSPSISTTPLTPSSTTIITTLASALPASAYLNQVSNSLTQTITPLPNSSGQPLAKPSQPLNVATNSKPQTLLFTTTKDVNPTTLVVQATGPTNGTVNNGTLSNDSNVTHLSTINHNQVISTGTTVFTLTKPIVSQSGSGQPQILTQVVSTPTNQTFPGVVLNVNPNPSRPAVASSNTINATSNTQTAAVGTPRTLAPRLIGLQPQFRLAPQIITRPGAPGVQPTFALPPTLRGTILVRSDTGQYQLVNVSPGITPAANSTIRLQVPVTGTTSLPQSTNVGTTIRAPQQMTVTIPTSVNIRGTTPVQVTQPLTIQTTAANTQAASATPSQMSPNTAKKKCKNFLSTLIRLASDQPEQVATNVRNLIQGLIDGTIQPEDFTNQLQRELNSSPQPCLVPFLKKSLPYLRHSLMIREMTIDGVRPPPPGTVQLPPQQTTPQIQIAHSVRPGAPATVRLLTGHVPGVNLSQLTQGTAVLTTPLRHSGSGSSVSTCTTITAVTPAQLSASKTLSMTSKVKANATKSRSPASSKEKEKKSFSSSLRDDDDINDVAAMGGVNLIEESQRILATNAEFVGAQIRSCKDEDFFFTNPLQSRINQIAKKYGLDDVASDVVSLISHAAQERLKTLVEKLGIIAKHRIENFKLDPRYEVTQDVRGQIKFLEELDRLEKKRHEEQEREMLLRAAKSRSKLEDPEQLKLKQKAKEMQRAELEEARQREANETALLAIGPRKKLKTSINQTLNSSLNNSFTNNSSINVLGASALPFSNNMPKTPLRRLKRVNIRDLQFLMEQEKEMIRSPMLYKAYAK